MRLLFIGLMLVFAFGAPAQAQNDPTSHQERITRQLEARQRTAQDIARNPGNHNPAGILGHAMALAQEGHSEEALRLAYFAEVRLRMDDLYVRSLIPELTRSAWDEIYTVFVNDVPPARRRALFEEAILLEARAPRRYESSAFGDPPRRQLASLRAQAVAAARARMEEVAARDTANAEIEASIASGAPAAEASAYIPQPWRTRVRALKSIRLSRECVWVIRLLATPPGAAPQAFILDCRTLASEWRRETPYQWRSWADLGETARIVAPGLGVVSVVNRGGVAYLIPSTSSGGAGSATLIGADGRLQVLTPSGQNGVVPFEIVSPSGRYAMAFGGGEVADLDANRTVIRREAAEARDERFGAFWTLITETERGEPQLVGMRWATRACNQECADHLVVLDVQSGQVRTLHLPPADYASRHLYGSRQAAIEIVRQPERAATESQNRAQPSPPHSPDIAIVDLDSMQVVWTGPSVEAPPPRRGVGCLARGVNRSYPYDGAREPPNLLASLNGEGFVLASPPRQAPTACAVSADGARLVILAPPFLHLYEITR